MNPLSVSHMVWGLKLENRWSFWKLHTKTNLANVFESWDPETAKLIVDTCARVTDILIFSGFSFKWELIVLLSEISDSDATLLHTHIYMMASNNFIMYDTPFTFFSELCFSLSSCLLSLYFKLMCCMYRNPKGEHPYHMEEGLLHLKNHSAPVACLSVLTEFV